jgi:Arm domain-containing DNA-binding protein
MGLGSLTEVKLADARQAAAECRQQRQDGIDPLEARERARRLNEAIGVSFRRAFEPGNGLSLRDLNAASPQHNPDMVGQGIDASGIGANGDPSVSLVRTGTICDDRDDQAFRFGRARSAGALE